MKNLEDVEIISQLSWDHYPTTIEKAIETALVINGIPFLSIEETIKFKRVIGREKDLKDIELLKRFIRYKNPPLKVEDFCIPVC